MRAEGFLARFGSFLIVLLSLGGCGGGGDNDGEDGESTPAAPAALSYASPQVALVGTNVNLTPTVTGTPSSYSVTPVLPVGLSLNASTGIISGAPTAAAVQNTYVITATNSAGSTAFGLVMTVNPAAPTGLSYQSPLQATVAVPITALAPTVTGTVASYSVSPALPGGLTLNSTTGTVSGTPTNEAAASSYTITASNAGGSTTFSLQVAVSAAPPTATGVFIDSVVTGLSYTSGSLQGETDASGRFTYAVGQNVTFHVGNVVLGTVPGKEVITPLDFVANGSLNSVTVQNIVRFLLLLDSDGNAANGITISPQLRSRADSWPAVDFATSDLGAALATVIPDTQVDGAMRQLPGATDAQNHFARTFRCMYSGYFRGTYSGDDNGFFAFSILPSGGMGGAAYSVPDAELVTLQFTSPLQAMQSPVPFVAGAASTGSTFNGQLTSFDEVSGTWTGGTFSGSRYAGSATAAYKFIALFRPNGGGPAAGSVYIELATDGTPAAVAHVNFANNQKFELNASLQGNQLIVTNATDPSRSFTAMIDTAALTVTGNWTDPSTGQSGTLLSDGCRLR